MIDELKQLTREWPGEVVVIRRDEPTDAWIFVALHSSLRGTPVGGTRMRIYESPRDGLNDALRLAEGMTYKWASLDLPRGGGKAVLALSRPLDAEERTGLLRRYGILIESMGGAFGTGEDLGTTPDDMATLAQSTQYVHGVRDDGTVIDPGPFTAHGVFCGIRAAVRAVFGQANSSGLTVLVQGVGDVGAPLARQLRADGAEVLLTDLDEQRAADLAAEIHGSVVDAAEAYDTECDLLAPCAIGGILNADTIPRLRCRLVAGSANNQLATVEDGTRLHDRGIVYLPDYVLNSGGALAFGTRKPGDTEPELLSRVERVGDLITEVLREARESGEPTATVARRIATARLDAARAAIAETPPSDPSEDQG